MNEKNSLKSILKYPLTVCFALFILCIFVLYYLIPVKEKSEWENRYLTQKPELSVGDLADGSYMRKYEDYINDQMPLRDSFITLKAGVENILLKIENNGISKGKDSYLFTKNIKDTSVFDKNVKIISDFSESIKNPVTVLIAPNACETLKDKVFTGFPSVNQGKKLEELYSDNSLLKSARVVDLKSVLDAHGDEYIYYRTDHHWTSLGAYYAYCEISGNPVNIDGLSVSYSDEFLGTLYAKYKGLFIEPDVISYYDIPVSSYTTDTELRDGLYDMEKLSVFDKYGMFMWGNFGRSDIKSYTSNGKRAVIFKDSYANCLIPFMTFDYEDITIIDLRYFNDSVDSMIKEYPDADVYFINNFDFLNEDNHFYKLMQ